jgi:predicted amidohydrolase
MLRATLLIALLAATPACGSGSPGDDESWSSPEVGEGPRLRVAAIQFDARPEEPDHNRAEMQRLARAAAARGAELLLFHENALLDYGPRVRELAEAVPEGPTCRAIEGLARELGVWIGIGLAESEGESVHITQAYFGPAGYVGRYRKSWLFHSEDDHRRDEWAHFDPGDGPALLEIAGLRTATMICADADSARFVEQVASLEPELVLFPNNRSRLPETSRFTDMVRRLGAPVVLANRSGTSWQYECNGGSAVFAADGRVLARANRVGREEILVRYVSVGSGSEVLRLDQGAREDR